VLHRDRAGARAQGGDRQHRRRRFTGRIVPVIQQAGMITQPISYASEQGGKWTAFKQLANTWTGAANLGLAQTTSGVRVLASVDNSDYSPVVSRWTGNSFSPPELTGDKNSCAPSSHGPVADASGRMADISNECEDVAGANLTDTLHAAVVRFPSGGTIGGGEPQLATAPRGHGWAAWSIEATTSDNLLAGPVLLPGRDVSAQAAGQGNQVKLTGPASCLPPVGIPAQGRRHARHELDGDLQHAGAQRHGPDRGDA
jgi:hypothetical protein